VTDGGDDVGLGVRDPVQLHRVALALDAGGGDDPLALDRDGGGAALPHRVDHGLDVLLVHDQEVQVATGGVDHLLGRVTEGDRDAGAAARGQPRGVTQLLDLPLVPLDLAVVDRLGEGVDLAVQRLHALLERGVLVGLLLHQRRQVGVTAGAQVGALAVLGAHHEQRAAQQDHGGGTQPPHGPRAARPAGPVFGPRVGSRRHATTLAPAR
jgi:hypothetical protein